MDVSNAQQNTEQLQNPRNLHDKFCGLFQKLGNLTTTTAREYLLRSIYETDELSDEVRNASINEHITTATPKPKVYVKGFTYS